MRKTTRCRWCKKLPEETPENYLIEYGTDYFCQECIDIFADHVKGKEKPKEEWNPSRRKKLENR